ncbi:hypothetical protein [Absidia glauca]|uniref:Uncharacterized protein n=1 Tax=Absidia glauca TaxID=4829 RepID=A0A168MXB2_ABSGL|nr:hypothetical protein [Absidia glauca]
MKELPFDKTSDDELLALDGRRRILLGILQSFDRSGRKEKEKTTEVVPRNFPALQLVGDTEVLKHKMTFETVDKFINMFELILYQNKLDLESAWEPAFISAIVHSNERAAWFKEELMGRNCAWSVARQKI